MTLLFVTGLVFVAVAIGLVGMAIAQPQPQGINRSLAVLEAMSSAPSELTKDLDRPFAERVLEPLQARALAIGNRLSGSRTGAHAEELIHRGNGVHSLGVRGQHATDGIVLHVGSDHHALHQFLVAADLVAVEHRPNVDLVPGRCAVEDLAQLLTLSLIHI